MGICYGKTRGAKTLELLKGPRQASGMGHTPILEEMEGHETEALSRAFLRLLMQT